jgi:hypothetical protein
VFAIIAPSAVTALIVTGNAIPMPFLFDLSHLSRSDISSSVSVIAHARRLLVIFAAGLAKGGRSFRPYLPPSMHSTDGLIYRCESPYQALFQSKPNSPQVCVFFRHPFLVPAKSALKFGTGKIQKVDNFYYNNRADIF